MTGRDGRTVDRIDAWRGVTPVGRDSLDPSLRSYIEFIHSRRGRALRDLPIREARQIVNGELLAANPDQEIHSVGDHTISGGGEPLAVRLYRPSDQAAPIVLFAQGGGWLFGNLETHDGLCRQLSVRTRAAVLAIDYRLAPEHRHPAAVDDIRVAVEWLETEGPSLGLLSSRIALVGEGAGGTLVTLAAVHGDLAVRPTCLALLYPALDATCDSMSYRMYATGLLVEADDVRWSWRELCPESARRQTGEVSPAAATDLSHLPPTLVQTAGFDVLRDEAEDFAARLASSGVDVVASRYESVIHGFYGLPHVVPGFRALAMAELSRFLRRGLDV